MDIKIVFFDIDGTIYDNKNKKVLESTKKALKLLHENNIKIAIATGRARYMLSTVEEILEYVDYFVLINGQIIMDKNEVIAKYPIDINKMEKLIQDMKSFDIAYGFSGKDAKAVNKVDDNVLKCFGGLTLRVPPVDESFYKNNDVYQMWAFIDYEIIEKLEEQNPYFQFIRWMDVGYDAIPKHASKGFGVLKLAEYLNLNVDNIIAFGDADNDYEMIRDVGYGIAMGNATEKVKSVAKLVTNDVSSDGIYNALKYLKLI